jgi:hypothetical protein
MVNVIFVARKVIRNTIVGIMIKTKISAQSTGEFRGNMTMQIMLENRVTMKQKSTQCGLCKAIELYRRLKLTLNQKVTMLYYLTFPG